MRENKMTHSLLMNGDGADDLDSEALYEIVDGKPVEKVSSVYANRVAGKVGYYLQDFAFETNCGQVFYHTMFALPGLNRVRRPDVGFVSADSWPSNRSVPRADVWPTPPDLAVEVATLKNSWDEMMCKVTDYFRVGVKLVWVILSRERLVYIHTGPTKATLLDDSHELDGGDLLPGFRLSIAKLFQTAGAEEPTS
jgi:Uma2 family endonuclease